MEKGEGPELKKRFGVKAYPTFFIIRPDGSIQHRVVSASDDPDAFIAVIRRGLNQKTSYDYLDKRYEQGKITKQEMIDYQIALNDSYEREKSGKIGKELFTLLNEKDLYRQELWPLIRESDYGTDYFKFVVDHVGTFNRNIGKTEVDRYLSGKINHAIRYSYYYNSEKPVVLLQQIREDLNRLELADKEALFYSLDLGMAGEKSDVDLFISLVDRTRKENLITTINTLDHIAYRLSKADLKRLLPLEDKLKAIDTERTDYVIKCFEKIRIAIVTGVCFQLLNYEEALKKADDLSRRLFVFCYIPGDDNCRFMAEQVFKQEEVGDLINRKFISLSCDFSDVLKAEPVKSLGVDSVPAFVILNRDGTLHHLFKGKYESAEFLERVTEGVDVIPGRLDKSGHSLKDHQTINK